MEISQRRSTAAANNTCKVSSGSATDTFRKRSRSSFLASNFLRFPSRPVSNFEISLSTDERRVDRTGNRAERAAIMDILVGRANRRFYLRNFEVRLELRGRIMFPLLAPFAFYLLPAACLVSFSTFFPSSLCSSSSVLSARLVNRTILHVPVTSRVSLSPAILLSPTRGLSASTSGQIRLNAAISRIDSYRNTLNRRDSFLLSRTFPFFFSSRIDCVKRISRQVTYT